MSDLPTATVVSTEHGPGHSSLLGPLAIVLAVLGTASIVQRVLNARLMAKLRGNIDVDFDAILSSLETLHFVFFLILLLCSVGVAVLTFLMWRRLEPGRLARTALAAFSLLALNALIDVLFRIAQFAKLNSALQVVWKNNSILAILLLIHAGGMALLLWFLHTRSSSRSTGQAIVWVGFAALGLHATHTLFLIFSPPAADPGLWMPLILRTGTFTVAVLCAAWLAWKGRTHFEARDVTASIAWAPAARGLRLYQRGLVWRLILTFSGYVLLFMAAKGRSRAMLETISWALPLMSIVTGAVMTIGVFQFARQPAGSRAGGPAVLAGVMMVLALFIDVSLFASLLQVLEIDQNSMGYGDISAARKSLEAAQSMANWGMALSLGAFVALLASFHRVARALEDAELMGQAFSVGVTIVLMGSVAWGLRYWLSSAQRITLGTAVVSAIGILLTVLVLVIAHLNLVGKLGVRMAYASDAEMVDEAPGPTSGEV